jgi:acylphosphatase
MRWEQARKIAESDEKSPSSVDDVPSPSTSTRKTTGRKGRFDPNIDWEMGKHLYCKGELVRRGEGLPPKTVYPTMADIAARIGTTKQNVSKFALRHNWADSRENFIAKVEEKLDEVTADSRARLIAEPLEIVDRFINGFFRNLQIGKVRIDAAADLDKMVRLRAFLTEREREKSEQKQVVTLEEMQATHRTVRARIARVEAEETLAGVLAGADAQTRAREAHEAGEAPTETEAEPDV